MQILKEKSRAKSQITFDEDFNVPDAKPDVGSLIQHKGRIIMEDVRLAVNGKADVHFFGRTGGVVPTPEEVYEQIKKLTGGAK